MMAEYVYFIQAGDDGPIKIGIADDPEQRRRELQTGNAAELLLLAAVPGSVARERKLHAKFAEGHVRGEWFHADTPGLQDEIRRAVQEEAVYEASLERKHRRPRCKMSDFRVSPEAIAEKLEIAGFYGDGGN